MKKYQTGSAHVVIIAILVIAILGLLGFVFWQNFIEKKNTITPTTTSTTKDTVTDPYAGWQTYTSKYLGFSVQYPSDWKLDTSKATDLVTGNLISADLKNTGPDSATSDVTIQNQPLNGSTGRSSSGAIMALGPYTAQYASMKYTDTINGLEVTELDMNAQRPYFAAVFTVGNNYIELDFNTTATKPDLSATATKILNSVKKV